MTHALLEDSPAIDSGDDSVLNAPHNLATDQRGPGFPRVSGTHVDIGAYEYQQAPVDTSQTSPFTVNKTGDTSDGTCGVADCSLREAISSGDSGDTVNVPMGTYTLTQGTELLIDKSLTLNGAGSGDTIIQAAASSADATSRVLGVTSGSVVAISDVTIQNGNDLSVPPNVSGGSGILNLGTLTLTSSAVRGNSAASGGGIHNLGTLTLTSSTISANVAGLNGGGGILNQATLTLTNNTVSGNSVESRGGGIFNGGATVTLTNSTITSNTANQSGGGIDAGGGTVSFRNTIIAGNSASSGRPDCGGTLTSQGHNLVQDASGCTIAGDLTGNITGQDPLLGPLQDNGGPTMTHALLEDSPAIDSGDDSVLNAPHNLATDQRGTGFPRLQGAHVDIGAYEVQQVPTDNPQTSPITVTKTDDTSDGFCGVLDCSLREAISSGDSGDTINFAVAGTITLTSGQLVIDKNMSITGPGSGDLTISGNNASRVFQINAGINVAISGVTITSGSPDSSGGGIRNDGGTLTITNTTISGNSAIFGGGGIYNTFGSTLSLTSSTIIGNSATQNGGGIDNPAGSTLNITDSTISNNTAVRGGGIYNRGTGTLTNTTVSGNTAESSGGGIYNSGTLTLTNSTVSGNTAFLGGGIYDFGILTLTNSTVMGNSASANAGGIANYGGTSTLTNSTVSDNTADSSGGGIANAFGATLTLTNSTITGNTASSGGGIYNFGGTINPKNTIIAGNNANAGPDCSGTLTSQGHNLIQDVSGCAITGDLTGNITGQDPLLGPLTDNGGPTRTHALLPGSPAVDSGDDSVLVAPHNLYNDQRGPGFLRFLGAHVDIGAFEAAGIVLKCNGLVPTHFGSGGDDTIVGTPGDDVIASRGGADTILAGEDNDVVCAGDGDDFVDGGQGKDRIYGENGGDDLRGGWGNDRLFGGDGEDVLRGGRGTDRLFGGRHDDLLKGGRHADRLFGEKGSDVLLGGPGNDRLFGHRGEDVLLGRAGDDSHDCGLGFDFANGGPGTDTATASCEAILSIP